MALPPLPPTQPSESSGSHPSRLPPPPGTPTPLQVASAGTGRMPPPSAGTAYGGPTPGKKRARNALALGVVGVIPLLGWLAAIIAIALGLSSQRLSRKSGFEPFGSAKAGVVLGVIGLVIDTIVIVVLAVGSSTT